MCPLRSSLASNPSQQMVVDLAFAFLLPSFLLSHIRFPFRWPRHVTLVSVGAGTFMGPPKGDVCMIHMRVYFFYHQFICFHVFPAKQKVSFLCLDLDTNCPRRLPLFCLGGGGATYSSVRPFPCPPTRPPNSQTKLLGEGLGRRPALVANFFCNVTNTIRPHTFVFILQSFLAICM